MIERPKVHQKRRQNILAEGTIEKDVLQHITDDEHQGCSKKGSHHYVKAGRLDPDEDGEGAEDHEIAMGEVDEAHDPKNEGETGGEKGVEAA